MKLDTTLPSPILDITAFFSPCEDKNTQLTDKAKLTVHCKRDDLIHPLVSGNKWRKLSGAIKVIQQHSHKHVISFGGGYSNHLHALSYACAAMNIKCTAVIRGDYHGRLTPTLQDMQSWGCALHFVSKVEYKKRNDEQYCASLLKQLGADYMIPEGGSYAQCIGGVSAILTELAEQAPNTTHIVLPVASGGTMAGLLSNTIMPNTTLLGIGVLKGEGYLEALVHALIGSDDSVHVSKKWKICHQYHHGGYAKKSTELTEFISQFNHHFTNKDHPQPIAIEPVYSGKCFFALQHLLKNDYFAPHSKIVILHTGGLQGARV